LRERLSGTQLLASLLYGTGMRLMECVRTLERPRKINARTAGILKTTNRNLAPPPTALPVTAENAQPERATKTPTKR
jgi:hypothetical protein